MPTQITAGHVEGPEKLTARLWWTPNGDGGAVEVPNVTEYNEAHEVSTVQRMASEQGDRRVTHEQPDVHKWAWEFTFDERPDAVAAWLTLGTLGTTVQQAAATAPAGTATITGIKLGRWHQIGVYGLDTVTAAISAATLTEGTDYDVDLPAGMIYIYDTAATADGDDVDLTFGNLALDFEKVTAGNSPGVFGAAIIQEFSQFKTFPARVITFNGWLNPTQWGTQSGEFANYKLRTTAQTKPVIQRASAYSAA